MHTRPPRRARGFTLLEAIVALVIFSMGAIALYGWLSVNTQALGRVEQHRRQAQWTESALDVVRAVNPMQAPNGRRDIGGLIVEWTSRPVEAPRPARTQIGMPGIFDVGLYEMTVRVRSGNDELDSFDVRRVGYRQVRTVEAE